MGYELSAIAMVVIGWTSLMSCRGGLVLPLIGVFTMWTCDFFVQHTIGFRVLYVFIIMELSIRMLIHFNVTEHPTLEWIKQQVRNACFEEQPKFLLHNNDGTFGQLGRPLNVERAGKRISCRSTFDAWLWRVMGIRGIPIHFGAPNANSTHRAFDRDALPRMSRPNVDIE